MGKIYNLFSHHENPPSTHSVESANALLPLVYKYTREAVLKTETLALKLEGLKKNSKEFKEICHEFDLAIEQWSHKIHRLGAVAKGLWLVDFDTGTGYLCWAYPEKNVEHFHEYDTGFDKRKKLDGRS